MLVLTRKSEQKIVIGENITITILKVQGDQVSVGIDAPDDMRIFRKELLEDIKKENAGGAVDKTGVDISSVAKKIKVSKQRGNLANKGRGRIKPNHLENV